MSKGAKTLHLYVEGKREIATNIYDFDLRAVNGEVLPLFTAGSHISVKTPSGRTNKYSLCNPLENASRYVIAVRRDEEGRGGSISMVDNLQIGMTLEATSPVNLFEMTNTRPEYVLIAGGIGITPIYAMMQSLKDQGVTSFTVYYLSRNAESAAYLSEITRTDWGGRIVIHHSNGEESNRYDLWPVLESSGNKQVYCCGPLLLMEEVKAMTGHWPQGTVMFESFGVDAALARTNVPFQVQLVKSGKTLEVDTQTTILEALTAQWVNVPSSCESGTCGSCKTALISGDVEHRDMVLDEYEQEQNIIICVSRGCGAEPVVLGL